MCTPVSVDPDTAFLEVFSQTSEFTPDDKKYEAYVSFNKKAVDRGRGVARRLSALMELRDCDALDIGAGSGGLAIALAEAGCNVTALEPDPVRSEWAKARIEGHAAAIHLIAAEGEELPFPSESFDLVTLDSVIELSETLGASSRRRLECCVLVESRTS
jgi:ubiquinone/menaquinone biosynthesis C-methylase UbiE